MSFPNDLTRLESLLPGYAQRLGEAMPDAEKTALALSTVEGRLAEATTLLRDLLADIPKQNPVRKKDSYLAATAWLAQQKE